MTKISVAYRLSPNNFQRMTENEILDTLRDQLELEQKRQNSALALNQTTDCTARTGFSNTAARKLLLEQDLWSINRQYPWDEMTRSEVYRILATWQQRLSIAELQAEHDYELDYFNRPEAFKFVKQQLWLNIQRSKKIPTLPTVKRARLALSKSSSQYSSLVQDNQELKLYLTTLAGDCSLDFRIPDKVWSQYAGWKATKPTIQLDEHDQVTFTFSLEGAVAPSNPGLGVLGVDLGIKRPYAASKISNKGQTYSIDSTSLEVERDRKTLKRLNRQISNLSRKNEQRGLLHSSNARAQLEEKRLRAKRERVIDNLDWQVAKDVVELAEAGETISLEKLNWGTGGPVKFRHSLQQSKIEHVARKRGRRVLKVSAVNSSHECPDCGDYAVPNSTTRALFCECGFSGDRDTAASIVLAKRASKAKKFNRMKNVATPRRPKPRRSLIVLVRKTEYTGSSLARLPVRDSVSKASLAAEYRSPIGAVNAAWHKRSTNW